MLNSLRQAANSWVAKGLLVLLVVSFAIWGVSGEFQGYGSGTVAQVGDAEVSALAFDRALQERVQAISNQTGSQFTMEQARAVGVPAQVLGELVSNAALRSQASDLNLGVSEDKLAQSIAADQTFHGPGGRFDRVRFQALLRNAGLREDDYVEEVREGVVRRQLAQALIGGIAAPDPMLQAFYRYQNEERRIAFVTVDTAAVGPAPDPDAATLQTYFEEHQAEFRAPEYRGLGLIVVDAAAAADPAAITDEEIAAEYERRIAEFTVPERRRIEQIRYDSADAARAAMQEFEAGKSFAELAADRNLTAADIDLGMKTKAELVDSVIADAAFAAPDGAIVPVYDGRLGAAIIRVAAIEPGRVTPLAEVSEQIRTDLANQRGRAAVHDLHDQIEDERAGGATLQETAEALSLPYRTVEAVARDGTAPDGTPVELPSSDALLADAFQSDVGVENDPVRSGDDSYVFYEVLETIPERDRTLDEARDAVLAAWRAENTAERVSERAGALFDRLAAGATLEQIASEIGKTVELREAVKRNDAPEGLSPNAVDQAFAGPKGHVANADGIAPDQRILLRVDEVTVPAYFAESAQGLAGGLGQAIQNDVLQTYNTELLETHPLRINNAVYAQITGAAQPN